jgi:hypothetical protein
MSNKLKQGYRKNVIEKSKTVKKHIKAFYGILGEMEFLANEINTLHPTVEFTEENINEYAQPIYGRELDGMEKFLVLGKIHTRRNDETQDNV